MAICQYENVLIHNSKGNPNELDKYYRTHYIKELIVFCKIMTVYREALIVYPINTCFSTKSFYNHAELSASAPNCIFLVNDMAIPIEVYGYHGTTVESAKIIIDGGFEQSRKQYDWLGDGFYSFQDAPERAWEWALSTSRGQKQEPAVVGAKINFEIGAQEGPVRYIDFLDILWEKPLIDAYNYIRTRYEQAGQELPRQTTGAHRLDRFVINSLVERYDSQKIKIPAVRATFQEGIPIFERSALYTRSHVQLAARTEQIILDRWVERVEVL